jgi:hypothetical protein
MKPSSISGILSFSVSLALGCSSAPPTASSSAAALAEGAGGDAARAFAAHVAQTGGLSGAGDPITPVFPSPSDDGGFYETRCYERRVLEYHPPPARELVLGKLVGKARLALQYPGGAPATAEVGTVSLGAGNPVRADFEQHWRDSGGLAENGYPLTDYFYETTADGRFLVQYFERAVFEYHPENAGTEYAVQGQLLGTMDPQCQAAALERRKASNGNRGSLNIRMAGFIPGTKPFRSDGSPKCERINFANIVGGFTGGVFNVNPRGFSYDQAMEDSKVALDVDVFADGTSGPVYRSSGSTCRFDDDAGPVFGDNDWCRKASSSPHVGDCSTIDTSDVKLDYVKAIAPSNDRVAVEARVTLHANDPMVPAAGLTAHMDAHCTIRAYFDTSRLPVDFWVTCDHKAFPSYELYVAGAMVKWHSAFDHSPGDLLDNFLIPEIQTKHHCTRADDRWSCVTE